MATKKPKSQSCLRRKRAELHEARVPSFESLRRYIDAERLRLLDAEAVLDCVILAMDEDRRLDALGPSYPNVVRIVRALLNEAINRLDSVNVKAAFTAQESRAGVSPDTSWVVPRSVDGCGVEEPASSYVH